MSQIDLQTVFLSAGWHRSPEEGICLMEAVSLLAGEPFSDAPECASPVLGAFFRGYNDALQDGPRQSLVPYIPRLIGTRGSKTVEERRALMALDWLVRVHTPAWLRFGGLDAEAEALEAAPEITTQAQVASVEAPLEAARAAAEKALAAIDYEDNPAFSLLRDWNTAGEAIYNTGAGPAEAAAWSPERDWVDAMAWDAKYAARAAATMGIFQEVRDDPAPYLFDTVHALIERMIAAQES